MREVTFDDSLQSEFWPALDTVVPALTLSTLDRLVKFYYPILHKLIGKVLYFFAKPRETPLADNFVLDSSARTDTAAFTLLNRLRMSDPRFPFFLFLFFSF